MLGITATLIGFFPVAYYTGWLLSILPLYFGLLKKATKEAEKLTTNFALSSKRIDGENMSRFLTRRALGLIAWTLSMYLVWWILLPYMLVSSKNANDVVDQVAKVLIAEKLYD